MATLGTGSTVLATLMPELTDTANIQTAMKQLYYGTSDGTLSNTTGIYGALYILFTGNPTLAGNVTISGNLTVNGTTTTVNSNTLAVDDKNLELGSVSSGVVSTTGTIGTVSGAGPFTATITGMSSTTGLIPGQVITATAGTGNFGSGVVSVVTIASSTSITISSTLTFTAGTVTNITGAAPSDASADSGGITLKGTTDKTFQWANTGANWTSSENLSLASGKTYKINNADIITGSATTLTVGSGASTSLALGNASGTTTLNGTISVPNTSFTYSKLQNVSAQYRVLGRITTAAGVIEELTPDNLITTLNQATTALQVGKGGTGTTTAPVAGAIAYGASTSALGYSAAGTTGQILRSAGTGTPVWSTATFPNTSTSGKLLYGDGTNWVASTPSYPNTATPTINTFIRSDGTNWVGSTVTIPATLTANQLMYSSSTTAITGLTTSASGVLVTDASSVPSISTSLPANLTLTTPTIDVINAASATGTTQTLFSNTSTGTINIGGSSFTTGSIILGGSGTGTIQIGGSTSTSSGTVNILNGAVATALTKTINIGTGSTAGTTTIGIGSATGSTTTINGTVQLTSGSTKIGNTTLTQGGTVSITLPTLAGTLAVLGANTFTDTQTLVTGTTTVAPLRIGQSTQANLLATPLANAIEASVEGFYATVANGPGRGLIRAPQMIFSLANSTAATTSTPINVFATGTLSSLEASKLYRFRGTYYFTTTVSSVTSQAIQLVFAFGTTPTSIKYSFKTYKSTGSTLDQVGIVSVSTASTVSATTTSNGAVYAVEFEGYLVSAASTSTLIPQFQMSTTNTSTVANPGSWFEIEKLGASTDTKIAGNWA
jgi:hypothetical protein